MALSNVDSAMRAVSGLLADVLKFARHDWQAAATFSVSICLVDSGLSHLVATRTAGIDEFTRASVCL
jgi:type IV secretory pathway TrbD component